MGDRNWVTVRWNATMRHNHPDEPVLVIFDDGRWEVMGIGKADRIAENDAAFVNYVPVVQVIRDADAFVAKQVAEERAAAIAKDVL
jgi:hypothetical protein